MFRRITNGAFTGDLEGDPFRYSVAGLWGSGNTITARPTEPGADGTVYSMWDGHALLGPGRPGEIERFPVFVAKLPVSEFLNRYSDLPGGCELLEGEEVGIGCAEACTNQVQRCPEQLLQICLESCAPLSRVEVECLDNSTSCDWERDCIRKRERPESLP